MRADREATRACAGDEQPLLRQCSDLSWAQAIEGRRLGRHVLHDPRSRDYAAPQAPEIVSVTHAATGLPLNQGKIGSCTANALCGALNSAPAFTGGTPLDEGSCGGYGLPSS